jgi:hypothetical protein
LAGVTLEPGGATRENEARSPLGVVDQGHGYRGGTAVAQGLYVAPESAQTLRRDFAKGSAELPGAERRDRRHRRNIATPDTLPPFLEAACSGGQARSAHRLFCQFSVAASVRLSVAGAATPVEAPVDAIALPVEAPVDAIALPVEAPVDAIALAVQTPADAISAAIQTGFDTVTASLETLGEALTTGFFRAIGRVVEAVVDSLAPAIEVLVNPVAASVQTLIDPVATPVETLFNAVSAAVEAPLGNVDRLCAGAGGEHQTCSRNHSQRRDSKLLHGVLLDAFGVRPVPVPGLDVHRI